MKKLIFWVSIFSVIFGFLYLTSILYQPKDKEVSNLLENFIPANVITSCQDTSSNCYKNISDINESPVPTNFNIYDTPEEYNPQSVNSRENVLIILDCSYSMDDEVRGKRKIDIARDVISDVLRELPANLNLGFRVYGQNDGGFLGLNGCKATELLVPISPRTQNAILAHLRKLDAVGWTPICYSLDQAIKNDFAGVAGKKRIILVSDGMDTCGGSPCDFAVNLMKQRKDVIIDVIGFDISTEPTAISQLKCVAVATHGKFYTANNAAEFMKSLRKSLNIQTEVEGKIFKPQN